MTESERPLGVVIVDDEPIARARLVEILLALPQVAVLGEAANATLALKAVRRHRPDIVFLDIEMPGRSGLELAAELGASTAIIFTTAHHEYALEAFGVEAVDYVLKPFGAARISQAIARVGRRGVGTGREAAEVGGEGLPVPDAVSPILNRILLQHRGGIVPVLLDHIVRLSAQGDYCDVVANGTVYLAGRPLGRMLRGLTEQFVRVHRSHAVNIGHVESLQPLSNGRLRVLLSDGTYLVASRRRSKALRDQVL